MTSANWYVYKPTQISKSVKFVLLFWNQKQWQMRQQDKKITFFLSMMADGVNLASPVNSFAEYEKVGQTVSFQLNSLFPLW